MCIVIVYYPVCEVINFAIFLMTFCNLQNSDKKIQMSQERKEILKSDPQLPKKFVLFAQYLTKYRQPDNETWSVNRI